MTRLYRAHVRRFETFGQARGQEAYTVTVRTQHYPDGRLNRDRTILRAQRAVVRRNPGMAPGDLMVLQTWLVRGGGM